MLVECRMDTGRGEIIFNELDGLDLASTSQSAVEPIEIKYLGWRRLRVFGKITSQKRRVSFHMNTFFSTPLRSRLH